MQQSLNDDDTLSPNAPRQSVVTEEPAHVFPEGRYETLTPEGKPDAFVPQMIANIRFQPSGKALALAEESTIAIARFDERYGQQCGPLCHIAAA